MKNLIFTSLLFLISIAAVSGQTMEEYFSNEGVETIGLIAHPFSQYKGGSYYVSDNYVNVTINYSEGTTKLRLDRYKNIFTKITVTYDSFFIPAFSMTELAKDFAIELLEESEKEDQVVDIFEDIFNKSLRSMSGTNLGCVALTMSWLDY